MSTSSESPSFEELGLPSVLLKALGDIGYETPSPIQARCTPLLLEGRDLLGQAQTGTGKTGAFALPLLANIDIRQKTPQLLVLTPTRELALQVAEAFQTYAHHMQNFHVLPIYGGQAFSQQLRLLKRGVHVVVGTPGRVMDHLRRKTLDLSGMRSLVLDEADEMLRMGFIDDVEWILEQTPTSRQTALFSATMPEVIRRVAQKHLNDPVEVRIKSSTSTATTIHQRYWLVSGLHKLDALTRLLETEDFDAMLIFARTRTSTVELADKLSARGYAAEALNGDIPQNQREKTVDRLKKGKLDILVATDVAARGLDVERISHVLNYDIPHDTESYVHRIGRTGRAGRKGEAILFVAPRERRLLRAIEKATSQPIEQMHMPSTADINSRRVERFKQRIMDTLATADLGLYEEILADLRQEQDLDPMALASALALMAQGNDPLLLTDRPVREKKARRERSGRDEKPAGKPARREFSTEPLPLKEFPDLEMERFIVDVGYNHDVKPGNIVGAIANEADIDSCYIGCIEIHDEFTTVDLPEGMPREVMEILKKARVAGKKMGLRPVGQTPDKKDNNHKRGRKHHRKSKKKPRSK
ncbi:DEAD/DEAH box helicase [Thiolapillus brandeum]|uniref:ATP-dependent RNA helicase DeaD n=1 Tax=Thiolapillus brandeum TaxID=1076588 RepID=A0A7U6JKI0_9GAMM|nr:DEAD/DEAH box helicase [Thiolapillus brandeum]BAO45400.1 ATP-dependent RNA helicase DeaD [Thiolapillus brandeum]